MTMSQRDKVRLLQTLHDAPRIPRPGPQTGPLRRARSRQSRERPGVQQLVDDGQVRRFQIQSQDLQPQ